MYNIINVMMSMVTNSQPYLINSPYQVKNPKLILIIIKQSNPMAEQSYQNPQKYQQDNFANDLGLTFNLKQPIRNEELISFVQDKIRMAYLKPEIQPLHFCSYAAFNKAFPFPNKHEAFKSQNLNIISVHLRYYQYIHQKMAIYKWAPSLIVVLASKLHPLGLLFPLVFTRLMDKYFKDFFLWKFSEEKIINIRSQFMTKLSKKKNKIRRINLFEDLRTSLAKENKEIPSKYIKFGENTKYGFHTTIKGIEQSSIYLTPMFQNYIRIKDLNTNSIIDFANHFRNLLAQYLTFRQQRDKSHLLPYKDYEKLITFQQIKKEEVYNRTKQIETRIQSWLEIIKHHKDGGFFVSEFSIASLLNLNRHYDFFSPQKFNLQTNFPDLCIFYGVVGTIKLVTYVIRRAIRL